MLISRNCDRWRACTLSRGRRTCCGVHRDSACRLYATWKEGSLQILRSCMHTFWALSKRQIAPSLWRIDTVKSFGLGDPASSGTPFSSVLSLSLFRAIDESYWRDFQDLFWVCRLRIKILEWKQILWYYYIYPNYSNTIVSGLFDDCKQLLSGFSQCRIQHVFREANMCSDQLARLGLLQDSKFVLYPCPPMDIKSLFG